ncbi:MAG: cytochrome c3 family protein [Thermodesulfobacteriota bacterium]
MNILEIELMFLNAKQSICGLFRERGSAPWNLIPALALTLLVIFFCAAPARAEVANTKHNLGTYSPGSVKSANTTQICIFCHTPHNSSPDGPLWNRNDSGATYTIYATPTMVASIGKPSGVSKLCLSCHDGAIAIGSVSFVNTPGSDDYSIPITVTGTGITSDKMTSASSAFIGTDLTDDHPISFDYDLSFPDNVEIVDKLTLPDTLPLDDNNNVQCNTCHDPHGTNFINFLTVTLESATLCTECHVKLYWDGETPIHDTDETKWDSTAPNPWHVDLGTAGYTDDDLLQQKCLGCHRSHGGAPDLSLTKGDNDAGPPTEFGEEWTCLNCHNGNVSATDMTPYFDQSVKVSEHPVMKGTFGGAMYDLHSSVRDLPGSPVREAQGSLDNNNRHSECVDCHNPHGAKSGNHTVGGAFGFGIGPNLLGGWGVKPNSDTWPAAETSIDQSTGYTVVDLDATTQPDLDIREGYMCMKCHSSYAYGTIDTDRPDVPSGNGLGNAAIESDLSLDFNPNNFGYHPVFAVGKNQPATTANVEWSGMGLTDTFTYFDWPGTPARAGFYLVEHTSTINCSDCHGSDADTDLKGPHGSTNKWILRGNETDAIGATATNFCYNCHRRLVYGDEDFLPSGGNSKLSRVRHPPQLDPASPFYESAGSSGGLTGNSSNSFGNLCLTCHGGFWDTTTTPGQIKGIHGSNTAAGPQAGSDPLGYRLMNGACVESYVRPRKDISAGTIYFVDATDDHCLFVFPDLSIHQGSDTAYDCADITDCNP